MTWKLQSNNNQMMSSYGGRGGNATEEGSNNGPLFDAAINGDTEKAAQVLCQNAGACDLEAKQSDGKTALHLAAERGNEEVVMRLLECGAYVDTKDRFRSRTALHLAVHNGHTDVAKILLNRGAAVDALDTMSRTPLHEAARQDSLVMMQLLLDAGCYVDPKDALDSTPLMDAAGRGHVQMVRLLLNNGANVNGGMQDYCQTPLIVSCERHGGFADVARILLEAGATVERRDATGSTALQYAAQGGNIELVQLLLEYAADPTSLLEAASPEDTEASLPSQLQENLQNRTDQAAFAGSEKRRFELPGNSSNDILASSSGEALSSLSSFSKPSRKWQFWRSRQRSSPRHKVARSSTGELDMEPPRGQSAGRESQHRFHHLGDSNIEYERRYVSGVDSHVDKDGIGRGRKSRQKHRFQGTGTMNGEMLDEAVRKLLETPQKQKGPPIRGPSEPREPSGLGTSFITPPPKFEIAKQKACDDHHISMLQFFVGGDQEQRLLVQASVHEALYGKGPSLLCENAREAVKVAEKPDFTWFHIPANNLTWAEHLITRLRDERRAEVEGQDRTLRKKWRRLDDTTRAVLNLAQSQQGHDAFLKTKSDVLDILTSDDSGATEQAAMLVLPYLHYETCDSFCSMTETIDEIKDQNEEMDQALQHYKLRDTNAARVTDGKRRMADRTMDVMDAEFQRDVIMDKQSFQPLPFIDMENMKEQLNEATTASQLAHHVSGDVYKSQFSLANLEAEMHKAWSTGYTPSDMTDERTSHKTFPQRIQHRHIKRPLHHTTAYPPPFCVDGQDVPIKTAAQPRHRRTHLHSNPGRSLLRGYLADGMQPRRSLDQYRYSDTRHRDADQVVTRHCAKHDQLPKLFVVDQLWLWVLGSHTLVTCAASPWDPWELAHETGYLRDLVTGRPMHEAMHVQKSVVNYLSRSQRRPVVDVRALANVVVQQCVNMFHGASVPRCLQFFDFFEETVASVMADVAMCLRDLKDQYTAMDLADIGKEMESLIEVADILDELDMLRDVLTEQHSIMLKYNKQILDFTVPVEDFSWIESASSMAVSTEAATSHMARIDAMETQVKKAQDMLFRITDLKQKHNGHIEALAAGEQAQAMAKQSNAVLLFTVITIIFLPISFMAAFFAIPIDGFMSNADGKLPINYVIKYMVSVGLSLSVPFVLIAFNLDKAAAVLKYLRLAAGMGGRQNGRKPKKILLNWSQYVWFHWFRIRSFTVIFLLVVGAAIILAPIWTSHVALRVKIAITISIGLLVLLGAVGVVLLRYWRRGFSGNSDTHSSASDKTID